MDSKTAIIIGAGPAGLTAAYELLKRTGIKPIVVEKSDKHLGGIARTVNYKGNRIDLGGHRFFSKSDRVMEWWLKILPLADSKRQAETKDEVMLRRKRKSRIYFLGKFFNYPITLNKNTLLKLGFKKTVRIGLSYLKSMLFPIKPEKNLEQFFINRFGRELYQTFFKSYTEKVWGMPCSQISAAWGAQRVKGLSVFRAIKHYFKKIFKKKKVRIQQKGTETSLIEEFLYPKLGPGQLWEETASKIRRQGGKIIHGFTVDQIYLSGNKIKKIKAKNEKGKEITLRGDYYFSSMPVQELIEALQIRQPKKILRISRGLIYRDFITVGLLLSGLKIKEKDGSPIRDTWIYVQEPDVKMGRIQIFNNWSPYLVANPKNVWLGLEYFCYQGGELWQKKDKEMIRFATEELVRMKFIEDPGQALDAVVLRMPKTYPAYLGTYDRFDQLQKYLDRFENLFLIGRNGMHRYNNQDHSMLTAMVAVDNILKGRQDKSNIWAINVEKKYHEKKQQS